VRTRLEATTESLRQAGVRVDEKARPVADLGALISTYLQLLMPIIMADVPDETFGVLVEAAKAFDPGDHSEAAVAARAPVIRHREWIALDEARQRLRAAFREFFARYDVLLCPVIPVAAIRHDHSSFNERTIEVNGRSRPYTDLLGWISMATACYLPATVAPVGPTPEGLPVGVQIIGPYLEDHTTIEFARLLGDVAGGFTPPPS